MKCTSDACEYSIKTEEDRVSAGLKPDPLKIDIGPRWGEEPHRHDP